MYFEQTSLMIVKRPLLIFMKTQEIYLCLSDKTIPNHSGINCLGLFEKLGAITEAFNSDFTRIYRGKD